MEKILVIDDDEEIRKLIKDFLSKENFEVETVKNGSMAIELILKEPDNYQLAVLDIMLPDISGIEVCKEIRRFSGIPILMLTAKSEDVDKIIGLEVGADDYLTKPFNPKELVARIKAILRRATLTSKEVAEAKEGLKKADGKIIIAFKARDTDDKRKISTEEDKSTEKEFLKEKETIDKNFGKEKIKKDKNIFLLEIIPQSRRIFVNGKEVKLTNKEYNMLIYFIENKDIVISREKLLENIWGYDFMGESRTIDVHVKELRKKINDYEGRLIETVWSVGYRLNFDRELNQ